MLMVMGGSPSKSKPSPILQERTDCGRFELGLRGKVLTSSRPDHSPLFPVDTPESLIYAAFQRLLKAGWEQSDGYVVGLHEESKR